MKVIEVQNLTKDYGDKKGVFDIAFQVEKGEVVGFLGPNGAGKTTTIRQLMGFMKPDKGSLQIMGKDCFTQQAIIQQSLGYLPGEIAFMEDMTGLQFIHFIADMRKMKDLHIAMQLMEFLELDAKSKLKKMSKGMKQKIAIVVAFMHDPEILILDEPTSGLDPLMQNKFIFLIQEAKKQMKTILMSSHMVEEVESTCDRVIMIKDGRIIANDTIRNRKQNRIKKYEIFFQSTKEALLFHALHPESILNHTQVSLHWQGKADVLVKQLSTFTIEDISICAQSLEEMFMHLYGGE